MNQAANCDGACSAQHGRKIMSVRQTPTARLRESGDPDLYNVRSSSRSRHSALNFSINSSFQARFHFLICRSRWKAASRVSWTSYQTSDLTPYFRLKPGTTLFRCSQVRRTRSSVMPTYSVPFRRLARTYTKKLTTGCSWVPAFAGTSGLRPVCQQRHGCFSVAPGI